MVQAAGRVIRTTSDEGVVYLIDDRFMRADIQTLFPAWWEVRHRKARCSQGRPPDRLDRAEKDFNALDAPREKTHTKAGSVTPKGKGVKRALEHAKKHQDQNHADGNTK